MEAVQFVEAVTEKTKPRGELRDLLKRACSRHQRLYQVLSLQMTDFPLIDIFPTNFRTP